jgi:methylated-DNA-protein-cysteine methyltransferase-like protein
MKLQDERILKQPFQTSIFYINILTITMATNNDSEQAIMQTLASIPYGKVCTYGGIAKLSGNFGKARYIGHILKNLPSNTTIPWHRVINSQGRISFPTQSQRYQQQKERLELESIRLVNNKINLKQHLWMG